MAKNLVSNVHEALEGFQVTSLHGWLDSTVALHWILAAGDCKQFVSNRVRKIRSHEQIQWRHIPTRENPADLGSRGREIKRKSYGGMGQNGWLIKNFGLQILRQRLPKKVMKKGRLFEISLPQQLK